MADGVQQVLLFQTGCPAARHTHTFMTLSCAACRWQAGAQCWFAAQEKVEATPWQGVASISRPHTRAGRALGRSIDLYWLILTAKVSVAVPLGATLLDVLPQLTAVAVAA